MIISRMHTLTASLFLGLLLIQGCSEAAKEIERPERIQSLRVVIYDKETYSTLAGLWEEYYKAFPSEDAYGNWMYAARYAGHPEYDKLLEKGLKKYTANPILLYLAGIQRCGLHDDIEGRNYLERAVALDPFYMDPWFALVIHYIDQDDPERTNIALRRLLEGGAIQDDVMDYSYNMLASLSENAILITNGDNDTYPGWILTRLLNHRPDVSIVNRSLLNSDWYPMYLIKEGLPKFITQSQLEELRTKILNDIKEKKTSFPSGGLLSDTLMVRLIESAAQKGQPVYFAATLASSEVADRYRKKGRNLGLVTLVTPPAESYPAELKRLLKTWLDDFRTGGLDSWRLHHAKEADAGRKLVNNYAGSLYMMMDSISINAPEFRLDLFRWYQKHVSQLISQKMRDGMNQMWCRLDDIEEIRDWCRSQGYLE